MDAGEQLRFYGPAGAPFVVTVGAAFTPRYIRARIEAGEWKPFEAETPEPPAEPAPEPTPDTPAEEQPPAPVKRRPGRPRKNP